MLSASIGRVKNTLTQMFTGSPELCLGRHHSSLGKGLIEQHLGTCEGKMAEIVAELRR